MTPSQPEKKRGISPLVALLPIPLFGVIAAVLLIANEGAPRTPQAVSLPSTPPPVIVPTLVQVVDAPVINFELPSLEGGTIRLSDYEGRIVFLNFWATWCEPCKRELPAFEQFTAAHTAPNDPVILAVNYGETPDQIRQFLNDQGIEGLNVALDQDTTVGQEYGIFNLPVTFVIDQRGIVRYPKYGEMTLDEMNAYIEALQTG